MYWENGKRKRNEKKWEVVDKKCVVLIFFLKSIVGVKGFVICFEIGNFKYQLLILYNAKYLLFVVLDHPYVRKFWKKNIFTFVVVV